MHRFDLFQVGFVDRQACECGRPRVPTEEELQEPEVAELDILCGGSGSPLGKSRPSSLGELVEVPPAPLGLAPVTEVTGFRQTLWLRVELGVLNVPKVTHGRRNRSFEVIRSRLPHRLEKS